MINEQISHGRSNTLLFSAEHHDFHMAITNNYSISFRWWDWAFNTDIKYRKYREKVKAAKAGMKNATQEERDAFERKLIDVDDNEISRVANLYLKQ